MERIIAQTYSKIKVSEQPSDFAYWQTQPPIKRLETLEQIRTEYHRWKNDSQPRLQRVFSIIKRELGKSI